MDNEVSSHKSSGSTEDSDQTATKRFMSRRSVMKAGGIAGLSTLTAITGSVTASSANSTGQSNNTGPFVTIEDDGIEVVEKARTLNLGNALSAIEDGEGRVLLDANEFGDTGNYPGLISPDGNREVYVDKDGRADYTSLQEAIDNEIYMFMRDEVEIHLQEDQTYNEDVAIPAFHPAEMGGIETGGNVDIHGNGAKVKSVTKFGGSGVVNPIIRNIDFVGTAPFTDDGGSVVAQGTTGITVKNCDFLPTEDGTERNYCIVFYTITGGKINQCTLRNFLYQAVRLKRWGNAEIQRPSGNSDAARDGEGELVRCSHGLGWVRRHDSWEGGDLFYVRGGQGVDADNGITYFNGGSIGP